VQQLNQQHPTGTTWQRLLQSKQHVQELNQQHPTAATWQRLVTHQGKMIAMRQFGADANLEKRKEDAPRTLKVQGVVSPAP